MNELLRWPSTTQEFVHIVFNGQGGDMRPVASPQSTAGTSSVVNGTDVSLSPSYTQNGHAVESLGTHSDLPVVPTVSIILPTRNEAENIPILVKRLEETFPASDDLELIFVDDSDDATVAAIEDAQTTSRFTIRYLHRSPSQRTGGLGTAVVAGLRLARGHWCCVMDADLQHPPELIPRLLQEAKDSHADIVVGSRYCQMGRAAGLNRVRSAISRSFTTAAKVAFPGALSRVSDPMSGFFLVRARAINIELLKPNGFKILLEILARHANLVVSEVGFEFGVRYAGESKASLREGIRYLSHLAQLRLGETNVQLGKFGFVGFTGIIVNLVLVLMLTELTGMHYLLSVILATQGSTAWNFVFSDRWVFAGRPSAGRVRRYVQFFAMNNVALLLRGPMIYVLTAGLLIHYTISTLISLVLLGLVRFVISDTWIWGREQVMREQHAYSYDIHGLISITSDVRLPELQLFAAEEEISRPTISVRVGRNIRQWNQRVSTEPSAVQFAYDEGLGSFGFSIRVAMSDHVDVLASPILRWSPHVLYTNVVEPILRWSLVKHGYALVHGACLAYGDDAYLVTARTDTGKTTTLLRILSRQRRASDRGAFISDDLTLVSADGHVLNYPKPLTISRHTVAAIDKPMLNWRERLALIIQSRLHSRDGRRMALRLANTRLPMATVNAIVQFLIPPPKYLIQRLVPRVKNVKESNLSGMIIIERGDDFETALASEEAYEILMSNSEDAFGFPPYSSIASFLQSSNGHDLVKLEREIVAKAVNGLPATLIRRSRMDWSDRIPYAVNGWTEELQREPRTVPELALDIGHD